MPKVKSIGEDKRPSNPIGNYEPRTPEDVLCENATDTAEWILFGGNSPMAGLPINGRKIPKQLAKMLGVTK